MSKRKKSKNNTFWPISKKGIIIYASIILIAIIIIIFSAYKVNLFKLMGSIFEIEDISNNINNIKIGDTINYDINGYSNWEVLSINKEDQTIEVVSKEITEQVTLTSELLTEESISNYFQEIADKYTDDSYAINARIPKIDELKNFNNESITKEFWIDDYSFKKDPEHNFITTNSVQYIAKNSTQSYNDYLFSYGTNAGIRVILTYQPDEYESINIGDNYTKELNGLTEWIIISKDDTSKEITLISKNLFYLGKENINIWKDLANEINKQLDTFKSLDKVTSTRIATEQDQSIIKQYIPINLIGNMYNGKNYKIETNNSNSNQTYTNYKNSYFYFNTWNNSWYSNGYSSAYYYNITKGIRPIVTLKYSNNLNLNNKDITTEIEIGDYIKYEANAYKNWKVLSIDKENKTVDIVSGGIVKNLKFGYDDYQNDLKALKDAVNSYKNGDNVVNARPLNSSDIEKLSIMKDKIVSKYWINDKKEYYVKTQTGNLYNDINYGVALAGYNESSLSINKEWVSLYNFIDENQKESYLTATSTGKHFYTAGVRPVITLKLNEIKKEETPPITDDINNTNKNPGNATISSESNINSVKNNSNTNNGSIEKEEEQSNNNNENTENKNNTNSEELTNSRNDEEINKKIDNLSDQIKEHDKRNTTLTIIIITTLLINVGTTIYFLKFRI